ncbi:MAG: hypothetical protein CMC70_01225 [Flavobacteriaceae bacterium]|nr:hypothetical protein [Flavobacteriaceae bacterium]
MMKQLHFFVFALALTLTAPLLGQDLKIYVSDAETFAPNTGKILQYDIDGSNPITFIDEELSWPQDIVFLADQNAVLISNLNSNKITKYNASTGAYIGDFAIVAGGPTRMKIGTDNLLYVLQWSATDNKVLRYELDGTLVGEFTSTGVPRSIGMDWDSDGNLYVSSFSQANVTSFDTMGSLIGEFVDNTELSGPTNVFIDSEDNLFVLDWNDGDVEQYDSTGGYTGKFIENLGQVEGVDFLANGNILLGNGTTSEIKQYLSNGMFVENTVPSETGGLEQPNAVILFDRSTLGNDTPKTQHTILVVPSIGSLFTINNTSTSFIKGVSIYDITGRLVTTLEQGQTTWNATTVPEGLYFVTLTSNTDTTTQKIIVKK